MEGKIDIRKILAEQASEVETRRAMEIWADSEKCAKEVIKIIEGEGKCQKSSG